MYIKLQRETTRKYSLGETSEWGLGPGDPEGGPRGILRGSKLKTGDPGLGHPTKIGGSGETTLPFYNIKRVDGSLKGILSRILPCLRVCLEQRVINGGG